jgi:hypothetical protein
VTGARLTAFAAFAAATLLASGARKETDWCVVEYPEQWDYRAETKGFDVVVTLKEGAPIEGNWLQPHLFWMRKAGFGGFQQWANPKKNPEVGKPYKFHYKPKVKDEVDRYAFRAYLAPNGSDKQIVKEQYVDIKLPPPQYDPMPEGCLFKKSYISIDENPAPVRVGEDVVLKVHYYLDPSETWGPKDTILSVAPLGPWIDNPDGVINKKRHHVSYGGGMFTKEQRVAPGDHVAEFRFKLGTAYRYNSCTFLCKFKTPDGKDWPWDYRGGSLTVAPEIETFRMHPTARGGMFYYDETPTVALVWGPAAPTSPCDGTIVVKDALNRVVGERTVRLSPARRVQTLSFPEIKQKGVFSVTAKAPGLGKDGADFEDFCYFGRIPRFERVEGCLTPFGVTNVGDLDLSCLAYDMGFSLVRHFTRWKGIEPMKGKWSLAALDAAIANNAKAGLKPWIQLYSPPAWTLPPEMGKTGEFEPAPFRLEDWGEAIDFLAKRYKGRLYGFEFLNEIVPGKACKDPVAQYVETCRVGYEAAKRNDSGLVCQLAGGLWPHSFRVDCLNAGVAKYVDVLPVHYSTFEGVREAQRDLAVRGIRNVRVADNETAKGYSIWNYPPDMAFEKSLVQCRHVMTRWPDELCAGAEFICYFGGNPDACGNWSYMIDLTSPRPVAATLAVVQGRLAYAKPVGKFFVGEAVCHLFERDGRAILFVAAPGKEGVKVPVPAKGPFAVVDFQGNETPADGEVSAGDMPVIAEGCDLDQLKMHAALSVGTALSPSPKPQVVAETAGAAKIPVSVFNPYPLRTAFTVKCEGDVGAAKPLVLELEPGETRKAELVFSFAKGAKAGSSLGLECIVHSDGRMDVAKPFTLCLTDESSLGNLVKNGGFEGDGAPWKGQGSLVDAPLPGAPANKALAISGAGKGYRHHSESVMLPVPGGTYLYSAWARGYGMGGGSNLDEFDANGKRLKNYMMLNVFAVSGSGTKGWNYYSKKFTFKPETVKLVMTPVAEGKKGARILYDNVQLSLYKGSDYVAFASPDASRSSPVPLLCENQVRGEGGYEWSERNLAGVARFAWDGDALVFEASVDDDVLDAKPVVSEGGEETLRGDAIALCVFPRIGPDGSPEDAQMRWYLSKASPGGGSGATTVYRPKAYSMGTKSGQLCKDSSVYQVDIRRSGTTTTYRLRIPWSEIPGFTPAKGVSFGCNIVLCDSDGGSALGRIVWGGGLKDDASDCGLVTLIP